MEVVSCRQSNDQRFRNPNPLTMHNDPAPKIYPCHPYLTPGNAGSRGRIATFWADLHLTYHFSQADRPREAPNFALTASAQFYYVINKLHVSYFKQVSCLYVFCASTPSFSVYKTPRFCQKTGSGIGNTLSLGYPGNRTRQASNDHHVNLP